MRMHPSMVEKILYVCTNYGGHKDEKKLVGMLESLRLSVYARETGVVLVETAAYINERRARNQPENDIVPMKLHSSALQKMLYLYNMYSGHSDETKMRSALLSMDFTPYQRNTGTNDSVLILTEDYMKILQGAV